MKKPYLTKKGYNKHSSRKRDAESIKIGGLRDSIQSCMIHTGAKKMGVGIQPLPMIFEALVELATQRFSITDHRSLFF